MSSGHSMFKAKKHESQAVDSSALEKYGEAITEYLDIVDTQIDEQFQNITKSASLPHLQSLKKAITNLKAQHKIICGTMYEPAETIKHQMDEVLTQLKNLHTRLMRVDSVLWPRSPLLKSPLFEDDEESLILPKAKESKDKKESEFSRLLFNIPMEILWKEKGSDEKLKAACKTGNFTPTEQTKEQGLTNFITDLHRSTIIINGIPFPEEIVSFNSDDPLEKQEMVTNYLKKALGEKATAQLLSSYDQSFSCYQSFFLDSALKIKGEGISKVKYTVYYDTDAEGEGNLHVRSTIRDCKILNQQDPEAPATFVYSSGALLGTELQFTDLGKIKLKLTSSDLGIVALLTTRGEGHKLVEQAKGKPQKDTVRSPSK